MVLLSRYLSDVLLVLHRPCQLHHDNFIVLYNDYLCYGHIHYSVLNSRIHSLFKVTICGNLYFLTIQRASLFVTVYLNCSFKWDIRWRKVDSKYTHNKSGNKTQIIDWNWTRSQWLVDCMWADLQDFYACMP